MGDEGVTVGGRGSVYMVLVGGVPLGCLFASLEEGGLELGDEIGDTGCRVFGW